jgi:hypothetical protein
MVSRHPSPRSLALARDDSAAGSADSAPEWAVRLHRLRALLLLPLLLLAAPPLQAQEEGTTLFGQALARGGRVTSQPSWREGGFGRLAAGADSPDDQDGTGLGRLDLGLDWRPSAHWGAHLQALGRLEPGDERGRAAGLVETYLHATATPGAGHELRFRLGHFFLPTSRENMQSLWSSPYTLTLSALNSWIGEDLRPTGLLAEYRAELGAQEARLGGSVFGGNDALGAVLAWRGWGMGDRLTVFGETLPLPPLHSLARGGAFTEQRDAGTRPLGRDLDGRPGWAAWARWEAPERALLQATHLDNRGDRGLYDGEYAWETAMDQLGAELHLPAAFVLAAEGVRGETGMGRAGAFAQLDFAAWYLLASWHPRRVRLTLRYDRFETTDRDRLATTEDNDEDGRAWTAAFLWDTTDSLRLAVELLDLAADRPAAAQAGGDPDTAARSLQVEVRWYF